MASTCRGWAARSAATAAGSARGSPLSTVITRAPAARAVVTAASVAASGVPERTRRARWLSAGVAALVAGSAAGLLTTWMPGSSAASACPAMPVASTARGRMSLICDRSAALAGPGDRADSACPEFVFSEVSSSGACARRADRAAAARLAGWSGRVTTTTGAAASSLLATPSAT